MLPACARQPSNGQGPENTRKRGRTWQCPHFFMPAGTAWVLAECRKPFSCAPAGLGDSVAAYAIELRPALARQPRGGSHHVSDRWGRLERRTG